MSATRPPPRRLGPGAAFGVGLALALAACSTDVILGRLSNASPDGGEPALDGGGERDGGGVAPVDGGVADGGVADGGVADSGAADGGAADGGAADGGVADSGVADSGVADGGTIDAGAVDASVPFPELEVSWAVREWVFEVDAGTLMLNLVVTNTGTEDAADASVSVRIPLGVTFANTGQCALADAGTADAGRIDCGNVAVTAGSTLEFGMLLDVPQTLRAYDFLATVSAASGEPSVTNNTARYTLAVSPPGLQPLPLPDGGTLQITYCAGTNITSFSQCVPSSQVSETFWLFPDGGWDFDATDGIPLQGPWSQSNHGRNLALGFFGTAPGEVVAVWIGGAVSATCFEGVYQVATGRAYAGAWRGCVQ